MQSCVKGFTNSTSRVMCDGPFLGECLSTCPRQRSFQSVTFRFTALFGKWVAPSTRFMVALSWLKQGVLV